MIAVIFRSWHNPVTNGLEPGPCALPRTFPHFPIWFHHSSTLKCFINPYTLKPATGAHSGERVQAIIAWISNMNRTTSVRLDTYAMTQPGPLHLVLTPAGKDAKSVRTLSLMWVPLPSRYLDKGRKASIH
jgi:hypothetical protein